MLVSVLTYLDTDGYPVMALMSDHPDHLSPIYLRAIPHRSVQIIQSSYLGVDCLLILTTEHQVIAIAMSSSSLDDNWIPVTYNQDQMRLSSRVIASNIKWISSLDDDEYILIDHDDWVTTSREHLARVKIPEPIVSVSQDYVLTNTQIYQFSTEVRSISHHLEALRITSYCDLITSSGIFSISEDMTDLSPVDLPIEAGLSCLDIKDTSYDWILYHDGRLAYKSTLTEIQEVKSMQMTESDHLLVLINDSVYRVDQQSLSLAEEILTDVLELQDQAPISWRSL